jgi:putative FmdB family regulatory protein
MPIYEYECTKCGERIEVIQKMSDKPLKKHAECGGTLHKLISASGFQFKGTGWYVTDYARKDAKNESKETKETKETTSSKDASSNGNKEGSGSKASSEKAGKKDTPKSGTKKD